MVIIIYFFQSLRWRIPRPISMSITFLQLSQMVIGFWVNMYAYTVKNRKLECDISYHHLNIGFGIYASYFALFLNFFYSAYFGRTLREKLDRLGISKKLDLPNGSAKNNGAVVSNGNNHNYGLRNRVGTSA